MDYPYALTVRPIAAGILPSAWTSCAGSTTFGRSECRYLTFGGGKRTHDKNAEYRTRLPAAAAATYGSTRLEDTQRHESFQVIYKYRKKTLIWLFHGLFFFALFRNAPDSIPDA
jgi:hypothetical protein